ncbi:response regulator [Paenibacillus sp. IB182496]|uniref:Response regulator n=1 Tax=Paenibacillus sabuli TaxID=2772509 RepID=A0A927GQ37_9BACL|nr:helix-turn-helix domain-containing protein [Paenibacillus sabuli]MBD2843871.1 response regulator [Paenibacillus sabuli]
MYSLLIMDDELFIRQGIMDYVPWSELGFEVVASFQDGSEGTEYLERHPVDVIISDICMTEVSGLAVAEYVYNRALPTKVVLLSGYKEFEYAKQAIAMNVEHYLLKPIAYEEIMRIFTGLRNELDKERSEKKAAQEKERRLQQILPLLQEHFFSDLLAGELVDTRERHSRMDQAGLRTSLASRTCCCAWMELVHRSGTGPLGRDAYEAIKATLRVEHSTYDVFPFTGRGRRLGLLVFTHEWRSSQEMRSWLEAELIEKLEKLQGRFGIELRMLTPECYANVDQMAANSIVFNPAPLDGHEVEESILKLVEMGKSYILQHFNRDLSLNEVADHVFLNPSYFSRMFKNVTGINFSEFLTQTRLDKAMALIREGNYKIYEVSEQVGFSSSKYFSTIFRQKIGCTPKEYDRLMKFKSKVEHQ